MSRFFSFSLRRAALFIVLVAALLPFGIIIATGISSYGDATEDMLDHHFRTVQSVAGRVEICVENVRNMLLTLSQTTEVRSADPVASSHLFRRVSDESPAFAGIFMTDPTGRLLASTVQGKTHSALAGPDFIAQTAENRDFTVCNLSPLLFGTEQIMQFGLPLYDRRNNIYAYIGTALQESVFKRLSADETLPQDAALYLLDRRGEIIALHVQNAQAQARYLIIDEIRTHVWASTENAAHFTYTSDLAGEDYFVTFHKLLPLRDGDRQPFMYVILATPKHTVYEHPADMLRRSALLMGLAALCAAAAGRYLTGLGFTRSVDVLLRAAARLRAGDFSKHPEEEKALYGELAALNEEFKAMAATVEKRNLDLAKARDDATASSKAKTEFLANMSHEIRTPMNAVTGMSYLALKTDLSPLQHSNVAKILESSNTLLRIINDILDLSKIEAGKLTLEHVDFRLDHVLGTFLHELQETAQKRHIVIVPHIPQDMQLRFKGDPLRLAQALNILATEAVDYCRDTVIEFTCATGQGQRSTTTLTFSWLLSGVFLPAAALEKFRLYLSGSGPLSVTVSGSSNLRLALARRILQLFGGTATVRNTPHAGAVFCVTVALYASAKAFAEQETPFVNARALIVDEQDASRALLARTLQTQGIRTAQLASLNDIAEALVTAEQKNEPFDFVVFDPPAGTGRIAPFIRRMAYDSGIRRKPAFILATSNAMNETPTELYQAGLSAFLPKPINTAFMADTLTTLMQTRAGGGSGAPDGGAP